VLLLSENVKVLDLIGKNIIHIGFGAIHSLISTGGLGTSSCRLRGTVLRIKSNFLFTAT
jgi:hypothetical protein